MIPKEQEEAEAFSEVLNVMNLEHWHIVQENMGSRDGGQVKWGRISKLKKAGWKKGVPDYLIYLPPKRCKSGKGGLLWVELKRRRRVLKSGKLGASPSTVYPEQEQFIEKVKTVPGSDGGICYGADMAIEFVKGFLK